MLVQPEKYPNDPALLAPPKNRRLDKFWHRRTSHLFKCVEFTENLMLVPGSDHKTAFIFTKCSHHHIFSHPPALLFICSHVSTGGKHPVFGFLFAIRSCLRLRMTFMELW